MIRYASEPAEVRGRGRDDVRLLVATGETVTHARFADLPDHLCAGDLLVVNTSATLAAAVDGTRHDGTPVTVHFSTVLDDGAWAVEPRPAGKATGPLRDVTPGERIALPAGAFLVLTVPYLAGQRRLWRAAVAVEGDPTAYLARHGRPIVYAYVDGRWPIEAYQTVFARDPGSAEMPSAARPFTDHLVTRLVTDGVRFAPVTLHAGVSSQEPGESPQPERYEVTAQTADLVNDTRRHGGRVVAVGTTVARALETAAGPGGGIDAGGTAPRGATVHPGGSAPRGATVQPGGSAPRGATVQPGRGWTDLVLGPGRPARVLDGIVTGWHEPGASHLHLLEAVAGATTVERAYAAAERHDYLWHEFGDAALLFR